MLKIEIKDMEDYSDVHVEAGGTPELIAEQLHRALCEINKRAPEVIALMCKLAEEGIE